MTPVAGSQHDLPAEANAPAAAAVHAPQVISPEPTLFTVVARNDIGGIGSSVRSLQLYLSDADFEPAGLPPIGIAVVGLDAGDGVWQYTTDFGRAWRDVGHVSDRSALLLEPDARLRFVPGPAAVQASFQYRGWDLSRGASAERADATGGGTAFSDRTGTATALVWSLAAERTPVIDAGGQTQLQFSLSGPEEASYLVMLDWGDGTHEELGILANGVHTAGHTYQHGWSAGKPTSAVPVVIEATEMISDDYEPGSTRLPLLAVSESALAAADSPLPADDQLPPSSNGPPLDAAGGEAPNAAPPVKEMFGLSGAAALALGAILAADSNWPQRVDDALESSDGAARLRRLRRNRRA